MVAGENNLRNKRIGENISGVGHWMGEVLWDSALTIKREEVRYEEENSGFDVGVRDCGGGRVW